MLTNAVYLNAPWDRAFDAMLILRHRETDGLLFVGHVVDPLQS